VPGAVRGTRNTWPTPPAPPAADVDRPGRPHRHSLEPATLAAALEQHPELPHGPGERFSGYGVMGLPFRTGHILGLRRFPASSIGPGYRSVWHRDPNGRWTFYQDQPPDQTCTRYFGTDVDEIRQGPIRITWTGPQQFQVDIGEGDLAWTVDLASTPVTRLLNGLASALPARAWHSPTILGAMSTVAGTALQAGRVRLTGLTSNGHRFTAHPLTMWVITHSTATIDGVALGAPGPAPRQARLRDFTIPQRGIFVTGQATLHGRPAGPSDRPRLLTGGGRQPPGPEPVASTAG
jgi:hypothetical protein